VKLRDLLGKIIKHRILVGNLLVSGNAPDQGGVRLTVLQWTLQKLDVGMGGC